LIVITIVGARFLWSGRSPDGRFWSSFLFWAEWVVLFLVGAGLVGRLWLPEFNGLTQRLSYLGSYLWLLVIVREIERRSLPVPDMNSAGEGNELDESGREVHAP
jgi:hypothetical protein